MLATHPTRRDSRSDYLWREVLERKSLTDIVENYAQAGRVEG